MTISYDWYTTDYQQAVVYATPTIMETVDKKPSTKSLFQIHLICHLQIFSIWSSL